MRSAQQKVSTDKFTFYKTGSECAGEYESTEGGIAVIRNFDQPHVPYKGANSLEDLLAFMMYNAEPAVFVFDAIHVTPVFKEPNYSIFLFSEDKKMSTYRTFVEVAKKF